MTHFEHARSVLILVFVLTLLNIQMITVNTNSTDPFSPCAEIELAQFLDKNIISVDFLKLGSDYVDIDGWSLATCNDYLYMTSWDMVESKGKMIIVDISDPTNLVEAGRVESLGSCRQVCVYDDIAYVADDSNGLWIFDVSDPANVSVLDLYPISPYTSLRGVYVYHQIAFLPTYYDGLRILNVSNPTNPIEVGSYAPGSETYRILVQDDCAYLANSYGLEILNITNPSIPSLIGQVESNSYKTHIYLKDDIVYISQPWNRLVRFNVSDPTNPYELELFYIGGVVEIQIEGSLLFASSSYLGFKIYNIHNANLTTHIGLFTPDGESRAVLYNEGYLYLVDHHSGLWCLEHDCDEDDLYSRQEYVIGTQSDNPDSDFDSMPDGWEYYHDLDPITPDASEDFDNDLLTNLEEFNKGTLPNNNDSDSDALSDYAELLVYGTDPINFDSDYDSMPDGWEVQYSLDPLVNDSYLDPDSDYLDNLKEYEIGTNPTLADSDFDHTPDGWEVQYSLDPLVNDSYLDPDSDYLDNLKEYEIGTNPTLADSDSDGFLDSWEYNNGFDPLDSAVGISQYLVAFQGWILTGSLVVIGLIAVIVIRRKQTFQDSYEN